jgi:hypothetical protein
VFPAVPQGRAGSGEDRLRRKNAKYASLSPSLEPTAAPRPPAGRREAKAQPKNAGNELYWGRAEPRRVGFGGHSPMADNDSRACGSFCEVGFAGFAGGL